MEITDAQQGDTMRNVLGALLMAAALTGCQSKEEPMNFAQLEDFATRYAAAWSSQNPASVAEFFGPDASLQINDGTPSVGRAEITAAAESFMTALPDLVVVMDKVTLDGNQAVFHWTLTGTNTGPGGTGNSVKVSGYEEWTLGEDGLVAQSKGHFDAEEYDRQLNE
jgi:uncharacterized protein (TIGR02246 family)